MADSPRQGCFVMVRYCLSSEIGSGQGVPMVGQEGEGVISTPADFSYKWPRSFSQERFQEQSGPARWDADRWSISPEKAPELLSQK